MSHHPPSGCLGVKELSEVFGKVCCTWEVNISVNFVTRRFTKKFIVYLHHCSLSNRIFINFTENSGFSKRLYVLNELFAETELHRWKQQQEIHLACNQMSFVNLLLTIQTKDYDLCVEIILFNENTASSKTPYTIHEKYGWIYTCDKKVWIETYSKYIKTTLERFSFRYQISYYLNILDDFWLPRCNLILIVLNIDFVVLQFSGMF